MEKLLPLEIPVNVKGKAMKAMVFSRHAESDVVNFFVRFSDGFEDDFWLVGEDNNMEPIGKREGWEVYAPSLLHDLSAIQNFSDGQLVLRFACEIDGKLMNVWITDEMAETQTDHLYVYYQGLCRFKMVRDAHGKAVYYNSYSGDESLNRMLAQQASELLPVVA